MIIGAVMLAAVAAPQPRPVAPPPIIQVGPPITPVAPPPPVPPPPQEYFKRAVPPHLLSTELMSEADYPAYALRLAQQGDVKVALSIGEDGRVTSCFVEKSSGYPMLDATTCRLLRVRARYAPARDAAGKAVPSAVRQSVSWRIPPEPLWPRVEWTSRVALTIGPDGAIKSCNVESRAPIESLSSDCSEFERFGPEYLSLIRGQARRGDATIVFETRLIIGRAPPKLPPGAQSIVHTVSRFTINPDGKISNCAIIEASGETALAGDPCQIFDSPYVPAAKATEAGNVMTAFVRP